MEWKTIKETIIQFLSNNIDRNLKTPERRLSELEKIELILPKEFIDNPTKILSINKKDLIFSLDLKNAAAKSIINNIYDILEDRPLKNRKRNCN